MTSSDAFVFIRPDINEVYCPGCGERGDDDYSETGEWLICHNENCDIESFDVRGVFDR